MYEHTFVNYKKTNQETAKKQMYKLKNNNNKGRPNFKIDTPNNGDVNIIAGTSPINALIKAVKTREIIISPILIGAINKFVKFLLQISSRKSILKPILVLKRKS